MDVALYLSRMFSLPSCHPEPGNFEDIAKHKTFFHHAQV